MIYSIQIGLLEIVLSNKAVLFKLFFVFSVHKSNGSPLDMKLIPVYRTLVRSFCRLWSAQSHWDYIHAASIHNDNNLSEDCIVYATLNATYKFQSNDAHTAQQLR